MPASAPRLPSPPLGRFLLLLLMLGAAGALLYRAERESAEQQRALEAEHAAAVGERLRLFRTQDLGSLLALCQQGWTGELSFYSRPEAVAWTRERVDGYFLQGIDGSSWRRLGCDGEGVHRGPRVERPFLDRLPLEAEPGDEEAADDGAARALAALAPTRLEGDALAVELVIDPATGEAIVRRWRGLEGGARATVEPADAPPFGSLIGDPAFRIAPGEPSPLPVLVGHRWRQEPDAAFDLIEKSLPAGARIVEITLGEHKIELSIEHPTPAFDGKPPAPYGDLDFDEHGIASRDWWYPREEPGFGCQQGRLLAKVRAEFAEARARVSGPLHQAWYSCSPAFSDGHKGVWHLVGNG